MEQSVNFWQQMPWWLYLGGGVLILSMLVRIFSKNRIAVGGARLIFIVVAGLIVMLIFSLSMNLYTYKRLTYEQELARVEVEEISAQTFEVTIKLIDEPHYTQTFELKGDEWQIDAQVLKWKGWAQLLGLNALYRLDRIGGRYRDIEQARENLPTVYSIKENDGLDIWGYAERHPEKLPFVDASYGSATYLPMLDGVVYSLSLSQTGLLARQVVQP